MAVNAYLERFYGQLSDASNLQHFAERDSICERKTSKSQLLRFFYPR